MKDNIVPISIVIILLLGGAGWWLYGTKQVVQDASPSASQSQIKEFIVTGSKFKFEPAGISVKKNDKVRIIFKNAEGMHDFVIDELKARTKQIKENESETIEFTTDRAGSFEYYCSVGTHRAMGMKGTLIVE